MNNKKISNIIDDNTSTMKIIIECIIESGLFEEEIITFVVKREKIRPLLYENIDMNNLGIYYLGNKSLIVNISNLIDWCIEKGINVTLEENPSEGKVYMALKRSAVLNIEI